MIGQYAAGIGTPSTGGSGGGTVTSVSGGTTGLTFDTPTTTPTLTGILGGANGGTGLNALGTSNQMLGMKSDATALHYKNLSTGLSAGGTDGVNITVNLSTGVSGGQTAIGSTSTNSGLTIKATTGVGTTGADIIFQVGNNGGTEAARITNAGNLGIGMSPGATTRLDIKMAGNTSGFTGISITNSDSSKLLLYRGDGRVVFSGNLGIIPVADGEEVYFNVSGTRTVKMRQGGSTGDPILATFSTTGLNIAGGTITTAAPTGHSAVAWNLGNQDDTVTTSGILLGSVLWVQTPAGVVPLAIATLL